MTKPSLTRNLNNIDLSGAADQQTLKWDAASGMVKPGYKPATSGADQHLALTDGYGNLTASGNMYTGGSFLGGTPPYGSLNLTGGSIGNNVTTGILGVWSAAESFGVSVTGNGFQITVAGVYVINLHLYWAANVNGSREVAIVKAANAWSGGTTLGYDTRGASPNGYVGHSNTVIAKLAVNDCIYATAWQCSGVSIAFDLNSANRFTIARLA